MVIKSFKELIVWQRAMELTVLVYEFTTDFPKTEIYGLVSQLRRAAVSIPSNIAEGWARKGTKEFINSLSMAFGSAAELETQLILSEKFNYGENRLRDGCLDKLVEVQKMLPATIRSLDGSHD